MESRKGHCCCSKCHMENKEDLKAHQITVFENVEHLKISSGFTPLEFRNILPETVYSS